MPERIILTPEQEVYLKANFPTKTNKELSEALGVSTTWLFEKTKEMGLKKDMAVVNARKRATLATARTSAERFRKISEARSRQNKSERRRILFGLPQQTNLKLVHNKRKCQVRFRLKMRGYGIERNGDEAVVLPDTKRSLRVERCAKKYGIRIIETQINT